MLPAFCHSKVEKEEKKNTQEKLGMMKAGVDTRRKIHAMMNETGVVTTGTCTSSFGSILYSASCILDTQISWNVFYEDSVKQGFFGAGF